MSFNSFLINTLIGIANTLHLICDVYNHEPTMTVFAVRNAIIAIDYEKLSVSVETEYSLDTFLYSTTNNDEEAMLMSAKTLDLIRQAI